MQDSDCDPRDRVAFTHCYPGTATAGVNLRDKFALNRRTKRSRDYSYLVQELRFARFPVASEVEERHLDFGGGLEKKTSPVLVQKKPNFERMDPLAQIRAFKLEEVCIS